MKIKTTHSLLSFLASILFVGIVSAQSTGYQNPTDTALPHGWTNPLNGMISDGIWATAPHTSGCHCPFIYLSWNEGASYSSSVVLGPYGNSDSWKVAGSPTDLWSHAWVDSEFTNKNFRVKISNSSTLVNQGYKNFNLVIPIGATIKGVEVNVEFHTDSLDITDYLNAMQVDVYYTTTTGIGSTTATSDNIDLYPTPAHNSITLHLSGLNQLRYSLFSIDGRMISDNNIGTIGSDYTTAINLEGLPSGIYFIRITSNLGTDYRKILVQ